MFINKAPDGRNNICGQNVSRFRDAMDLSQRELAELLQVNGLNVDKNAVQRLECGKRFVTDIEIITLAKVLRHSVYELLGLEEKK